MTPILLHLIPAALYGFLAVHFWRSRYQKSGQEPIVGLQVWERLLLLATLAVHGLGLYGDLFPEGGMRFGFAYALNTIMWLAILLYWIESLYTRLDGLQMLGLPLAAICVLLPLVAPGQHSLAHVDSSAFRTHFLMAMLAYSLFTLAALHALLMAVAEKQLHRGRLTRAMINLPPLLTMEALLFRLILIAFVLLTLTLASGILFSESLFGKALSFDHKTVFAIASWVIFAALLVGRHFYGWRGRKALRWTLAGFAVLMLAYVGTRFVLEAILHRA